MIHSGGYDHRLDEYFFTQHGNGETIVTFVITPAVATLVAENSSIGGKVFNPDVDMSYGFEGEVRDPKIREMVDGCMKQFARSAPPPPPPPPVAPQPRPMSRTGGMDILGGDLLPNGIRNVTLDECELACMSTPACLAVSYVTEKRWCWPKGPYGRVEVRPGVISSVKPN